MAKERRQDENRDPISGAPGAHPVGTGIRAAVGAVVGGLAGKGVAEMIDPTAEEAYWAQNYEREPYYERGYSFTDYHPGYRTGWEGDYARNRGQSRLEWEKNRHAARAAWRRFDREGDAFERSQ